MPVGRVWSMNLGKPVVDAPLRLDLFNTASFTCATVVRAACNTSARNLQQVLEHATQNANGSQTVNALCGRGPMSRRRASEGQLGPHSCQFAVAPSQPIYRRPRSHCRCVVPALLA